MIQIIAILVVILVVFVWLIYDAAHEYDHMVANRGYGEVGRTEIKETTLTDTINAPRTIRVGHDAVAKEYIPYTPLYKKSICEECNQSFCEMCALYDKVKKPGTCMMCGRCKDSPPCPYCSNDRKFEAFTPDDPHKSEKFINTPGYLRNIDDVSVNYFAR